MKKMNAIFISLVLILLTGCNYVIDDIDPTITGIINHTILVGEELPDLLNGVEASDNIDGDITEDIIVDSSNVNINTTGTYLIYYSVKDNANNKIIVPALVVVNEINEDVTDTTQPIIRGVENIEIEKGTENIDYLENVTATDNIDGNITDQIIIIDSSVNLSKVGNYTVIYHVKDSSNNITIETCDVTVVDSTNSTFDVEGLVNDYLNSVEFNDNIGLLNIESQITRTIEESNKTVVGVITYQDDNPIGSGSGVIYKRENNDYYIVTNHHVVEDGTSYEVALYNKIYLQGTLIGSDDIADLAVIKINTNIELSIASFGEYKNLKQGQFIYSLGSPLGLSYLNSVTTGVISGLSRAVPDEDINYIQHDTAINPGNSGGALFDIYGNLIGINVLKQVSTYTESGEISVEGMGFAIPIDIVKHTVEELVATGTVQRPLLGVEILDVSAAIYLGYYDIPKDIFTGVYVANVSAQSVSDGILEQGDIIIGFNDIDILSKDQFLIYLWSSKVNTSVSFKIIRSGSVQTVHILLSNARF